MILIGLNDSQKRAEIARYVAVNGIAKVFLFYPERFSLEYPGARRIEYREIIMYRTFYPLLEEIGPDCLLVFHECLRTQKRGDLTYNCAHHYCNQTPHRVVFEHFPFIEDVDDFMILLDLVDKDRYKGKPFDWSHLAEQKVLARRQAIEAVAIPVPVAPKYHVEYERKKEELFAGLGEAEPDTIPRQLHLYAGRLKRGALVADRHYVARNDRFKLPNVATYKTAVAGREYAIIDFPHRRLDLCDFLKLTGQSRLEFLCTPLKVDHYYFNELTAWIARLEEFYAQAGIYQQHRP